MIDIQRRRWLGAAVLSLASLIGVIVVALQPKAFREALADVGVGNTCHLLAAALGLYLLNAFVLRASLRFFDVLLGWRAAFLVAAGATLWTLLPGAAGLGVKAIYLRQRLGLSYAAFSASTGVTLLVAIIVSGIIGEAALLGRGALSPGTALLAGTLALLVAAAVLPLALPVRRPRRQGVLWDGLRRLLDSWSIIRGRPQDLAGLAWALLLRTLGQAYLIHAAGRVTNVNFDAPGSVLLAALAVLTLLINITPGGLGVREGLQTAVAAAIGFPAPASLAAVGLATAAVLLLAVTVGALSSTALARHVLAAPDSAAPAASPPSQVSAAPSDPPARAR